MNRLALFSIVISALKLCLFLGTLLLVLAPSSARGQQWVAGDAIPTAMGRQGSSADFGAVSLAPYRAQW